MAALLLLSACSSEDESRVVPDANGVRVEATPLPAAPTWNAGQDMAQTRPSDGDETAPSPDADLSMELTKAIRGPLSVPPDKVVVGGREWRPIKGAELHATLFMHRLHDPECDYGDVCDEVFLENGRYLNSGIFKRAARSRGYMHGRVRFEGSRYCTTLPKHPRRCFGLMTRGDGFLVRLALGTEVAAPRLVDPIPVSRDGGYPAGS
jgi:hypothetical protein